jgi:DNA-binding CsgD family transcriptional regulator
MYVLYASIGLALLSFLIEKPLNRICWTPILDIHTILGIITFGILMFLLGLCWIVYTKPASRKPASIRLTKREQEVLQLIISGHSNKEICSILFIEQNTLKTHIKNIYKKGNCNNRHECIETYKHLLSNPSDVERID